MASRAHGPGRTDPRGLAIRGRVWPGGSQEPLDDAVVVVDATGRVAAVGPQAAHAVGDLPVVGGPQAWVGPGIVDAHVHLAFGSPADIVAGGVTTARDLGAPPARAAAWRQAAESAAASPHVFVAGPIVTAPGGYPSQGWGRDGFAMFVDAVRAYDVVRRLAGEVDVIKVAIEPAGGPVPSDETLTAVVRAAHDTGVGVTAHALTVDAVQRAVRAGVDELAHTPIDPLPAELVDAIAARDLLVVSTLQTFTAAGGRMGESALANARALHAAGVRLCYGSDLGNTGTSPGVSTDELRLLAETGLGAVGALRAATEVAASSLGVHGVSARIDIGAPADVVVLRGDPITDLSHWTRPIAVLVGGHVAAKDGRPARHP